MLTNIISRWSEIQKLKDGIIPAPIFVDFHTSNYCNQACEGCAYLADHTKDMLDEKRHFQAVDTFLEAGVKAFDFAGGGEPTMLPYLPKLMRYIHSRGASFGLITNGTVMTDELINALCEGATYVRFSLEASNQEDYKAYKKRDDWNKVIRNIHKFNYEKDATHSGCEVGIKFAVGKSMRGYEHYQHGIVVGETLGADRITFKALRHEPDELSLQDKILEDERADTEIYNASAKNVVKWIAPMDISNLPNCTLNAFHTMMDHTGDIFVCCYHYWRREDHLLGNIFETPFEDIWYSEKHWEKIKAIKKEECAKVDCKFHKHAAAVQELEQRGKVNFL